MKRKKIAFLFPGQGCQYYHMALPLYQQNTFFREWLDQTNELFLNLFDQDLLKYIFNQHQKAYLPFDQLKFSQPLIILMSVGIAQLLYNSRIIPDILIGSSLGEISAALFGQVFSLENLFCIINKHSQLFESLCPPGKMLVLYGKKEQLIDLPYQSLGYELCAINSPEQIGIAGPLSNYSLIVNLLKTKNIPYEELPVQFAFHTTHIDPVKTSFQQAFNANHIKDSLIPIYSTALINQVRNFDEEYFWSVVRKPIYLEQLIKNLDLEDQYLFIDVGPSGNFATLTKYNLAADSRSKTYSIITPFTREVNLNKILNDIHEL